MRRSTVLLVLVCLLGGVVPAAEAQYEGVERGRFYSAANRRNIPYNIYLPPGYHEGKEAYPVIYWFHGALQDENFGLQITPYLHNAIVAGDLPPMILVLGTDGIRATSGYRDWGRLGPFGEQAVLELIGHIDENYRTLPFREFRAIEGFSLGGLCAMYFAAKHLELFCSAVALGGALDEPGTHALVAIQAKFLRENTAIKLAVGSIDPLTLGANRRFTAHLTALEIPHEYEVLPGAIHTIYSYFLRLRTSTFAFHAAQFYGP